jgi:hypothetical protein
LLNFKHYWRLASKLYAIVLQRNNRWVDLAQIQTGLSYKQSANLFGVHRSTIYRLHQRFRTTLPAEWRQIPQATIRTVRSMRQRCTSVRGADGGHCLRIPTVTVRKDIYEWRFGFSLWFLPLLSLHYCDEKVWFWDFHLRFFDLLVYIWF